MDIGKEEKTIIVEPVEDPFTRPTERPVEPGPAAPVEEPNAPVGPEPERV